MALPCNRAIPADLLFSGNKAWSLVLNRLFNSMEAHLATGKALQTVQIRAIEAVLPVKLVNTNKYPYSTDKHKIKKYFYFYIRLKGSKRVYSRNLDIDDDKVLVFALEDKEERDKCLFLLNKLKA